MCPPDIYLSNAADLHVLLAAECSADVVDDFINLVGCLPIVSKGHAREWDVRAVALANVGNAITHYQIALTAANGRDGSRDFLRQFRDLKKWPTKRRLLNVLERDKDESDLRPAQNAILFAIVQVGSFGGDVPLDWLERLGDRPNLLRKVAETVCQNFAYKVDGQGRPRDPALESYADRLAQVFGELMGKPITYAKATDTSPGREAGEPFGHGFDFMLAGLRLIAPSTSPYQAVTQIEGIRLRQKISGSRHRSEDYL